MRFAFCTNREEQLVIVGNVLQQAPGPFETQLSVFVQQQVGLECATDTMAEFDVGPWPTRRYRVVDVYVQQQPTAIQSHEGRCLQLVLWILDETADLLW